jgi:Beta-glucanase/Beta-glucan synthetase
MKGSPGLSVSTVDASYGGPRSLHCRAGVHVPSFDELFTGAVPPPEPPRRRQRGLWVLLAVLAAAALAGVLVVVLVVVRTGESPTSGHTATRTPPTLDPSTRSPTEAAVQHNWPLVADDEFNGSALDTSLWSPYTGTTTDGVGRHRRENISVSDGMMTITSHGAESGGMAWSSGQQYGRWEVRARSQAGNGYGPVLLLWPDAEDWPTGGEIDFMEIPKGDRTVTHITDHYGPDNSQNASSATGDFTQWHNFAVEWVPDHLAGFIDGKEVFRTTDPGQIPPRPMHLAIQQDIGPLENWVPAPDAATPPQVRFQVDWVRIYST